MLGYAESPADLARGRDITELRTGDLARRTPEGLVEIVGRERPRWRPETAAQFDANLATIEQAIAAQRLASRGADDVAAREALHASYQRQVEFLQDAILRGEVTQ